MFDTNDIHGDRLRAIRHNIDFYARLGLFTDKELAHVDQLTTQAHRVTQFAAGSQAVAAAMAESAVAALVAAGPVDDASVAEVAATLPNTASVDLAAGELYRQSATEAWELMKSKRDRIPGVLNKAFNDIRKQAVKLAPHTRPYEDAAAALRAGHGDEWLKMEDLMSARSGLLSAITMLRRDRLLYEGRYDTGGYSRFKHPEAVPGFHQLAPHKQFYVDVLEREDWVPGSDDDVKAAVAADKETANA